MYRVAMKVMLSCVTFLTGWYCVPLMLINVRRDGVTMAASFGGAPVPL